MSIAAVIERSHKDKESWRYTDLEKLLALPSAAKKASSKTALPSIADSTDRHQLVFINGKPQPDMSSLGALPKGVVEFGKTECKLHLEDRTCLAMQLIELVFVNDDKATESECKLQIEIGQNARLTIAEHHMSTGAQAAAHIMETEIHLGAQSKLVHGKILHDQKNIAHLARTSATVEEGAYYRNFALLKDARLTRNEIDVKLAGKQAQCALNGIMLLRGKEHIDTLTRITHAASHGISRQHYKSIVKDQAHGVFQGKVMVAQDAQKTDAQQLSRALLLSDQAEMDAKPELMIYADDVSCSHGCTVGDLDADTLFYLRARGIDEQTARALLLRGFIGEVIDNLHVAEWREYARDHAGRWLDE